MIFHQKIKSIFLVLKCRLALLLSLKFMLWLHIISDLRTHEDLFFFSFWSCYYRLVQGSGMDQKYLRLSSTLPSWPAADSLLRGNQSISKHKPPSQSTGHWAQKFTVICYCGSEMFIVICSCYTKLHFTNINLNYNDNAFLQPSIV